MNPSFYILSAIVCLFSVMALRNILYVMRMIKYNRGRKAYERVLIYRDSGPGIDTPHEPFDRPRETANRA